MPRAGSCEAAPIIANSAPSEIGNQVQWQVTRPPQQQSPMKMIHHKGRCDLCVAQLDSSSVTTSCGHSYHQKCLESYAKQLIQRNIDKIRCPACMVPLNVNLSGTEKGAIPSLYQEKPAAARSFLMPLNYKTSSPTPIPEVRVLFARTSIRMWHRGVLKRR
jgi:hypothetical protein